MVSWQSAGTPDGHLPKNATAQRSTSTYYALAPFIGALLSVLFLGDHLSPTLLLAALIMAAGCFFAARQG